MRTNSKNVRYVQLGEFAMRRVADEVILVPFRGRSSELSHLFQLNEVAAFVWNALESPAGVDDLVPKVLAEFEVEEAQARRDVEELLAALVEAELVRSEGQSG